MTHHSDNLLKLLDIKKNGAVLTGKVKEEFEERMALRKQRVWEMLYPNQPMRLKKDGTEEQGDTDS